MSHQPDSPFGCTESWGPAVTLMGRLDGNVHVCNRATGHEGRCRCKCGSWLTGTQETR